MRKLQATLMMVAFVFSVAACGGGEKGQMESLAKEACECKDMKCYDGVKDKWKAMEKGLEGKYPKRSDAPKDLIEAYSKNRKSMRECRKKLREAEKKK